MNTGGAGVSSGRGSPFQQLPGLADLTSRGRAARGSDDERDLRIERRNKTGCARLFEDLAKLSDIWHLGVERRTRNI